MCSSEVIEKAFDSLNKMAEVQGDMKAPSAERLEAMAKVTATVPWERVHSLKIDWETVRANGEDELLPRLDLVMKGDLP